MIRGNMKHILAFLVIIIFAASTGTAQNSNS
jgi:hypothetical protein